ncbi:serine/threonine-protein kinase [Friedmanniella endophytica]|uniref:non-specific serine/threonine protein kinase n=1 Tax=Microlunatus kandeliicorticis TaxID=1759536 RepID=A0A7W3ISA7_9ACTN|nr:Stk1 family PASTA domain-containing Ser/Thr kinase [Microlunatus kandeliicorticis]MBA8794333.1 serine/threonine-protein kinase [Microlunatus kandeliicorticis]
MSMTSVGDPLVGHVLDGRYRIEDRLARGGMATVYRATDLRLTRTVAVKVMHAGLGDDAEFSRKFDREARAAARLSHPHVVSVFDQGTDDLGRGERRPYIVMEYVEGQTLRNVISRQAPLTAVRALELMEPVLSALAAAHDAGLVHRDVKPENVLISDRGQIKVADFGLAKAISAQTSTATQGLLIGTVSYLPPELVTSGKADARSDVYSAGVVLFELLTGRKPHTGDTPIQVAYAHVHTDVPPVSSFPTAGPVPDYLDALISRVTARNADARPPDARVMLTQLRRVKSALTQGVTDDPELTQDLTVPLSRLGREPRESDSWPGGWPTEDADGRDDGGWSRADAEPTDLVGRVPAPPVPARPERSWPSASPTENSVPHDVRSLSTPPHPLRDRDERSDPRSWRAVAPADGRTAERGLVDERAEARRQRARRRRLRGAIVLLLVLLLTALAAYTGWYLAAGRFTTAPAVTTMTRTEAQTALARAGLSGHFEDAWSEDVSTGTVISTVPGAGAKVVKGGEIEVTVSKGPERHAVPAVAGMSQAAATAALRAASLGVGTTSTVWDDRVPSGQVIRATPAVGARLRRDTPVNLTVSKGKQPITVTDWTGKDAGEAARALDKAGFDVTVTSKNSDTVPAGRVISQSPDSGTGVKGDDIALVKSLGPVMVSVPNVRAMGIKAAQAAMQEAGFKTTTQRAATNYLGLGYVAYTSRAAGSKAPKGSTITLFIV